MYVCKVLGKNSCASVFVKSVWVCLSISVWYSRTLDIESISKEEVCEVCKWNMG